MPEPGPVDETQSELEQRQVWKIRSDLETNAYHSESIDLPSRSLGFLACNCSRRSEWIGSGAGDTGFPGRSTADEGMRCRWAGSRQPEQPWEARCLMIRCVETGRFCDKRISQSLKENRERVGDKERKDREVDVSMCIEDTAHKQHAYHVG